MPDNTKASTEADTVEIKQEIPSYNASPNDKSSADSSPANKDGDLVNGGEEITTITETTKVTGSDGKVTISTNKKVQKKPSMDRQASMPGTPRKSINNKNMSIDLQDNVSQPGTPKKTAKPPMKQSNSFTKNNSTKATPKKVPSKPRAPSAKRNPTKRPTTTGIKKRAPSNARKPPTSRQRSQSPKKPAPNKATTDNSNNNSLTDEKTTMNGTAFEIKLDSPKTAAKRLSRKPIHVKSTRPPKIMPRGRSPMKSPKKVKASGGAWR